MYNKYKDKFYLMLIIIVSRIICIISLLFLSFMCDEGFHEDCYLISVVCLYCGICSIVFHEIKYRDNILSNNLNTKIIVNKKIYICLAILMGGTGIHRLYARQYLHFLLYLLLAFVLSPIISSFLGLIDMSVAALVNEDRNRLYQ